MLFMNTWDIDQAVDRYKNHPRDKDHPVLGRATRLLAAMRDLADENSDGWAYWPLPCRACKKLMEMIQNPETADEATFKKAIRPIKTFCTKHKFDYPDPDAPIPPDCPFGVCPDTERWVSLPFGGVIAFENIVENPDGTSYVRILDERGGEIAYWDSAEWAEAPEEVMGAICGGMLSSVTARPEQFYQFGPRSHFPKGQSFKPYGE